MTNYLFIDGSYYCFYRYYALLTWWKNAHKDEPLDEHPFDNSIFVEKFKSVFNSKINEIIKKLKIQNPKVYIGKDCHRTDIWRNSLYAKYKENRNNDDIFLGGPFFKLAYSELYNNHPKISGILYHENLEADDCIAIATKHILETDSTANIYIITSDHDYIQLSNERTHLFNLKYKSLLDSKAYTGTPQLDLFSKIVMGDKSDNIPSVFSKCGKKMAEKCYNDPDYFQKKLNTENKTLEYQRNLQLINFEYIPSILVEMFYNDILKNI